MCSPILNCLASAGAGVVKWLPLNPEAPWRKGIFTLFLRSKGAGLPLDLLLLAPDILPAQMKEHLVGASVPGAGHWKPLVKASSPDIVLDTTTDSMLWVQEPPLLLPNLTQR